MKVEIYSFQVSELSVFYLYRPKKCWQFLIFIRTYMGNYLSGNDEPEISSALNNWGSMPQLFDKIVGLKNHRR